MTKQKPDQIKFRPEFASIADGIICQWHALQGVAVGSDMTDEGKAVVKAALDQLLGAAAIVSSLALQKEPSYECLGVLIPMLSASKINNLADALGAIEKRAKGGTEPHSLSVN